MIFTFANQKGGVGKTTLDLSLVHLLDAKIDAEKALNVPDEEKEFKKGRILVIDMTPEHNATDSLMKFDPEKNPNSLLIDNTIMDTLINNRPLPIRPLEGTNIDLVPSSDVMIPVEIELAYEEDSIDNPRAKKLKLHLEQVKDNYDHIFIDTPGSFGLLTFISLCAADVAVIVTSIGKFEFNTTVNFLKHLTNQVVKYNADIRTGVVFNMTDQYPITDKIKDRFKESSANTKLFNVFIPKNNAVRNATDIDQSVHRYNPYSPFSKASRALWSEMKEKWAIDVVENV